MSSFLDEEAEESDVEEEEEATEHKMTPKKQKKLTVDSDSDEEDDEDGEEVNDLIDDNPIDEDSDNESEGSRKRKKSDDEDDDLDDRLEDEDYELIEENLGVKLQRKQFKRLRRMEEEDSDTEAGLGQGEREAIANQLFEGSDNEDDRPPQSEAASQHYASEDSEGEYSETDDFIVDDEGRPITERKKKVKHIFTDAALQEAQEIFGVDFDYEDVEDDFGEEEDDEEDEYEDEENRVHRRSRKQLRRKRKTKKIYEIYEPIELERAGYTDKDNTIRNTDIPERMQMRSVPVTPATDEELDEEAEWIYKNCFQAMVRKRSEGATANDEDGNAANDPTSSHAPPLSVAAGEDWEENWETETGVGAPATPANKATNPGANEEENWEEDWETDADANRTNKKASASVPLPPATALGVDESWEDEDDTTSRNKSSASVGNINQSIITGVTHSQEKLEEQVKPNLIAKIKKSLEFMRNHHLEVPFIAFYRKEYVHPDIGINDLWRIYRSDAQYCQLNQRKKKLLTLFKNMKEYQTDWIISHGDEPIPDNMRLIKDEDLERVATIKTPEELKDIYSLFGLYYAEDVLKMKRAIFQKKLDEQRKASREGNTEGDEGAQPSNAENDPSIDGVEVLKSVSIQRKAGGGSYSLCKKLGIETLVKRFGLSPDKFAENVSNNYQRYEVEQYPEEPEKCAKEFVNDRMKTPQEVLQAAKFMVAMQISREPSVRQTIREVFFDRATISIHPTKKGRKEIDESHNLFILKYLKEKPVRDLIEDQFLRITVAETDKLVTLKIGENIKGMTSESYVDELKQLYNRDEFSKNVQEWNQLRNECVELALEKFLFPLFRKELRTKLLDDCKDYILTIASNKLYNWIRVAPITVDFNNNEDEDWDTRKGIRILSLSYVPDLEQASFACIIEPDGEPSEYLRLQNIVKSKTSYRESDKEEKMADLLALKNLIRNKKPHLALVGGESRDATMIQKDIQEIFQDLMSEEGFPSINVEIVDNHLSKVYGNSIKAQADLRDFPIVLRQAVSLARRMQDPLIEFSQLCNPDEEILCLRYHSLQDYVPKEELLDHLMLEFVNRTNECGVDVNRCISHSYTSSLLQFVCGLGPRKANALMKILKQNNQLLENRTQLITVCHMGPKIFINCSGFIKIDTNSLGDSTESYVEVLDGTRVHPETYEWARKMAVDALEYEDEDANPAGALEEILETPERLKDLDLDAFAEELERQGFGNKFITLYDIRSELSDRYKDLRVAYRPCNQEELFNMLTKETPESLYVGKLVTASVVGISHKKPQGEQLDNAIPVRNEVTGMWQCAFCMKNDFPDLSEVWNHFDAGACPGQATGVRVRLDNGISGFIPIAKLSDSQVTNPENRVKRGQTIHCRIVRIDVDRFSVECTSRTSDLIDAKNEWRLPKDPYYDFEIEKEDVVKDQASLKKKKQTYVKRVIVHPSFKNISFGEAEKLMEVMDQGEVIVRPSSKGADHLTVTWKVADGVYQHIDVREQGKENDFSLGQTLLINNEEFEDLDEIIARHINPMASHVRDILNFKYCVGFLGNREKTEAYLLEEKKSNANKIHYCLQASKELPGKFMLSYIPRNKPVHEFITVTPDGFRFRQQVFDSLGVLFKWFKDHYKDPPPRATPSIITPQTGLQQAPAITPRFNDTASRMDGSIAPSHFGIPPSNASVRATPHFGQYNNNAHTPYTPSAQTPFMTPYQSASTPRPNQVPPGFPFPRPSTVASHRTPTNVSIARSSPRYLNQGGNQDSEWRRAAEAWAKSQQKGQSWAKATNTARSAQPSLLPPKSPARNAAQVIIEGIQKTKRMTSSAQNILHKSPRSGRESLKSTPRTNFSPRSMIESSIGDETPLYDEN